MKKTFSCLLCLVASCFWAGIFSLFGELLAAVFLGRNVSPLVVAAVFALLLACFLLLGRRRRWVGLGLLAVLAVGLTGLFFSWRSFSRQAVYGDSDFPRELYAGKTVMVIVPHEDDEVNLMGGVTEAYLENGSTVYVVFVTNGDNQVSADTRLREALAALEVAGVPESNVIFLGYGDGWRETHLYNAPEGTVVTSEAGFRQVYGLPEHPAYSQGADYTRSQLLSDLQGVLREYRPEVIFCSDLDGHPDHKATSLAFEEAMGRILREEPDYRPLVYKGYAYSGAWLADTDFFGENILSTPDVFEAGQTPGTYRWEARVRFPVLGDTLSRSIFSSRVFRSLEQHFSQRAWLHGESVVSGDRVFWLRRTDSLCYTAEITAGSGDGALLTDFRLVDCADVADGERQPYDGVWCPSDPEKTVTITLEEPTFLAELVLYDHPDPARNIRNVRVTLPDGTTIDTGALEPGGAATVIPLGRTAKQLTLTLTDWEGDDPGLSEIELFESEAAPMYVGKLQDENGNFVYDYWTAPDGIAEFTLYAPAPGERAVCWDNPNCEASWDGEVLRIHVPQGERCVVTLPGTDRVTVSNPTEETRQKTAFWQKAEQNLLQKGKYVLSIRVIHRVLRELGKMA